jgi:hypothetical protein
MTRMKKTLLISLKGLSNLELLLVIVVSLLGGWTNEWLFFLGPALIQHAIAFYLSEKKIISLKGELEASIYTALIIVGGLFLLAPILLAFYFLIPNWNPSRTIGSITIAELASVLIGVITLLVLGLTMNRLEAVISDYADRWQERYFHNEDISS